MESTNIVPDESVSLFVKNILVFEERDIKKSTLLPFFADGYPGLMFQDTENGLLVSPHNKQMPILFLYGQTIKPIELVLKGSYKLIVFQLYPFVLKNFFQVNPVNINDNCYDLAQIDTPEVSAMMLQLQFSSTIERINIITSFLYANFQLKKESLDLTVRSAIQLILENNGQYPISKLPAALNITARTLERRFLNATGISPKQFSKIIQFQSSLEQLTTTDYAKLTDIVYDNGFADQSHFIKVFKAFTGQTPKKFHTKKPNK